MTNHKQIVVSLPVYDELKNKGQTGDSFDKVLRKLLGLPETPRKPKESKWKSNPK